MGMADKLAYGAVFGLFLVVWSYHNWRLATKAAMVVVLFEGALRKWIFPQFSDMIYFLKDGMLLGVYAGYFTGMRKPILQKWPHAPVSAAICGCGILSLGVLNSNTGSLTAALLGLKNYVFYMPLMFVVPSVFSHRAEFRRQISAYVLLDIPICILGLIQWQSDAFSVLNTYSQGVADHGATSFGSSSHVRITGTFSYLTGHNVFCCIFFALSLALICIKDIPYRWLHLWCGLPLLAANALMSGSRAAVLVQVALLAIFALVMSTSMQRALRRSIFTLFWGGAVLATAMFFVFPEAVEASLQRFAGSSDGVWDRTFGFIIKFTSAGIERGGAFGYGLGTTSPAVSTLRRFLGLPSPWETPTPFDFELGQVLLEVGYVGAIGFYGIRIAAQVCLIRSFFICVDPDIKPLLLGGCLVTMPFFLMSLVFNHIAGVMVWSFTGFAMWRVAPWRSERTKRHQTPCRSLKPVGVRQLNSQAVMSR